MTKEQARMVTKKIEAAITKYQQSQEWQDGENVGTEYDLIEQILLQEFPEYVC
jgi:hypothetical protein